MKGQNLKQLWESLGPVGCIERLTECLDSGKLKPEDFSLRELAEAFCGHDWVRRLDPKANGRFYEANLLEAGEGVDVSAFSNITGQIFFNKIREGWDNAALIGDRLVETFPSKLDGERMPWLGHVKDEGEEIHPGQPYPESSFGERYIDTPRTQKMGMIVSVTKEMIFFDLTGQVLRAASEVGYKLGYNKEKRILRVVLGISNSYKLNGTANNTYLATGDAGPWINKQSGLPLTDYEAVQTAYTLFSNILDPDTGNPIITQPKAILCMPARMMRARRIVNATAVRTTFPGYTSTSNPAAPGNVEVDSGNPLPDQLEVLYSPIAYQLLVNEASVSAANANDYWYIGDFKQAFVYVENWPLTVVQAPANSVKEFEQDIVLRYKASERGTPAVYDPRKVAEFYNA